MIKVSARIDGNEVKGNREDVLVVAEDEINYGQT